VPAHETDTVKKYAHEIVVEMRTSQAETRKNFCPLEAEKRGTKITHLKTTFINM
jgi:hypothetical protein